MMKRTLKKILLPIVPLMILGFASTAQAARCYEKQVQSPTAWDIEYNYKKTCAYGKSFSGFIGSYYYTGAGVAEINGPWTDNRNDYNCPSAESVYMTVFNPTAGTQTWWDTGYFEGDSTASKIISRTPTAWETRTVWYCPDGGDPV
jgi:hypothetical protein